MNSSRRRSDIEEVTRVQLPKLDFRGHPKLQLRFDSIRESVQTIKHLEQISQELLVAESTKSAGFLEIPQEYKPLLSKDINTLSSDFNSKAPYSHRGFSTSKKDLLLSENKIHSSRTVYGNNQESKNLSKTQNNQRFKPKGINLVSLDSKSSQQYEDKQKQFQQQSQPKFKKLLRKKADRNNENKGEDDWINDKWEEAMNYELQTGENLSMIMDNLAKNLRNLLTYKSEQFCLKLICKLIDYSKKLKMLFEIETSPLKEFTGEQLLQRYLGVLFKAHSQQVQLEKLALKQQQSQQFSSTFSPLHSIEMPSVDINFPLIHDKQFIDNIIDLHNRIQEYILSLQRNQLNIFQSNIISITKSVADKEIEYKNQLMDHQKRQSYMEFHQMLRSKYTLDVHCMKSKLASQIRNCENKHGDIKLLDKQVISKSDCIDKIVSALERLELY